MTNKIKDVIEFVSEKHSKQKRKVLAFPYIVHLFEVFQILREENCDEETLIVGLLHDVVEDTGTSLDEVREKFGESVAQLVGYLTEIKSLPYIERKAEHAKRLEKAPLKAKLVKCADCLSNLKSIYYDMQIVDNVFKNFNSTPENLKNYYSHSIEILGKRNVQTTCEIF